MRRTTDKNQQNKLQIVYVYMCIQYAICDVRIREYECTNERRNDIREQTAQRVKIRRTLKVN